MAKGDLFSTVLRGFHKEQVSQYLNDLIRKYEREKEELNKKYEGISPNVVQEPVSYTHLDVYKRQSHSIPMVQAKETAK